MKKHKYEDLRQQYEESQEQVIRLRVENEALRKRVNLMQDTIDKVRAAVGAHHITTIGGGGAGGSGVYTINYGRGGS